MPIIDRVILKQNIHKKFGSLTNFGNVTDTDYKDLLRILNSDTFTDEEIEDVQEKYLTFDLSNGVEGYINESEREVLRICIFSKFKSYTKFCEKHDDFDVVYLSNIVEGKLLRVTDKYEKLLTILKEEYNYDKFTTHLF